MKKEVVSVSNFENAKIEASLEEKIANLKCIMDNSSDLMINRIEISGHKSALITCEAMVSTGMITQLIFHPLMDLTLQENSKPNEIFNAIQEKMLLSLDRTFVEEYGKLMVLIMSGFAVIIVDGVNGAIGLGVQGYEKRSVDEPSGESNIKGAREGFVENIRVNMSLVRRRLKSPTLKLELLKLGSRSKTDCCLVYLTDKISNKMLKDVKNKLSKINLETILTSGYVIPFLEGNSNSIFQNIGTTERPDSLCAKILEGRIGLIVDGTPFVIIIPYLFIENFQTLDDYNCKPYYATIIRLVKFVAFILTILLPGIYISIATFHPELLNDILLMNLSDAEQSAPFPLVAEALAMLVMYEIIRESGLRLPKAVGGAVSIVGGLVIGDAAVASGLISTPLLIVVALSVTSSFVIPSLNQQTTILRFVFTFVSGIGGLYLIALILGLVMFNICAMDDFGIPATAPITPFTKKSLRDTLFRINFKKMQNGNVSINQLNGVSKDKL